METRGPRILQRDFAPRFSLDNQHKDLTNALALAQDLKVSVPAGAAVHEIYQAARAQGKGSLDSAAVIQVLEALANTTVEESGLTLRADDEAARQTPELVESARRPLYRKAPRAIRIGAPLLDPVARPSERDSSRRRCRLRQRSQPRSRLRPA